MIIRTKRLHDKGVARLETSGEIKEIILNENFMDQKHTSVSVCFRGEKSSGIIELTPEEVAEIHKEVSLKKKLLGKVKIMKFKN